MSKRFSVLIVSLKTRARYLDRLLKCLAPQLNDDFGYEVLIDDGEETIGRKRQNMIEASTAKFVAFIDDDDVVSDDYGAAILEALSRTPEPDVVGFRVRCFTNGAYTGEAIHSLRCKSWSQCPPADDGAVNYLRTPNHLNPIRREIALQIGYKPMMRGEDAEYSQRLYKHFGATMHEVFIDGWLYDYLYRTPHRRREGVTLNKCNIP